MLTCSIVQTQTEHILQEGDTLYSISREYGVDVSAIQSFNDIDDPRKLIVGQKLLIPGTYEVKKGDTLYAIARDVGISISRLYDLNGLDDQSIIVPGQVLIIPGQTPGSTSRSIGQGQLDPSDVDGTAPNNTNGDLESVRYVQPKWPVNAAALSVDDRLSGAAMTASRGDSVVAIASGTVIWNAPFRGYGWMVIVESTDRYVYVYGGNEEALVQVGDKVRPGTEIGKLGVNPRSGEATLYFSVFRAGKFVDPAKAPRI